jgi:hypothetical protein
LNYQKISLVREAVTDTLLGKSAIPTPPPPPPKDYFKITDEPMGYDEESAPISHMENSGINVAQAEKMSEAILPKVMDGKGFD